MNFVDEGLPIYTLSKGRIFELIQNFLPDCCHKSASFLTRLTRFRTLSGFTFPTTVTFLLHWSHSISSKPSQGFQILKHNIQLPVLPQFIRSIMSNTMYNFTKNPGTSTHHSCTIETPSLSARSCRSKWGPSTPRTASGPTATLKRQPF